MVHKTALIRRASVCALSILLLAGGRATALRYRPAPDETLSHVALIHYGSPRKFVYLLSPNAISDPDRLPSGRSLWVPTVWRYRVRKGDTLGSIAARYLKDSSRADFLLWLNRIKDPKTIEAGTLLTIPFLIRHRVQRGQTMVDVARRYYFSSRPAGLLRRFNGKRTNALKAGEIVWVPIYDPEAAIDKVRQRRKRHEEQEKKLRQQARQMASRAVKAARPAEKAPAQPAEQPAASSSSSPSASPTVQQATAKEIPPAETAAVPTPRRASRLIQKAFRLYRDGEYELARATLLGVIEDGKLQPADEAEAREILAFCLVALGRERDAEHEFVRLLMVVPDRTLDPVTTSPKVLKVFERAKGAD